MKLNSDEDDPDPFITNLGAFCARMNKIKLTGKSSKTETDLILHVLVNIPEVYTTQITVIETLMGTHTDTVTIELLRNKLNAQYGRLPKNQDIDAKIDHENALLVVVNTALAAMSEDKIFYFVSQFKGR